LSQEHQTPFFENDPDRDDRDIHRAGLLEHFADLRRRFIFSLISLFVGFGVCYAFVQDLYAFLVRPLVAALEGAGAHRLIYTGPAEAFITYLKLAFWGGAILALPFIASQVWIFVAPGLYRNEKRVFLLFLAASPVLFSLGAAMAYFLVFPLAWKFFLGFETPASVTGLPVQMEARVSEYLSLSATLLFAFGVSFQMPVFLVFLARARIVSAASLALFRRYAIVLIFSAAAVLTPPDALSQICLALPLMALYEISIWGARAFGPKNTHEQKDPVG